MPLLFCQSLTVLFKDNIHKFQINLFVLQKCGWTAVRADGRPYFKCIISGKHKYKPGKIMEKSQKFLFKQFGNPAIVVCMYYNCIPGGKSGILCICHYYTVVSAAAVWTPIDFWSPAVPFVATKGQFFVCFDLLQIHTNIHWTMVQTSVHFPHWLVTFVVTRGANFVFCCKPSTERSFQLIFFKFTPNNH